jgi:hypothetical protein
MGGLDSYSQRTINITQMARLQLWQKHFLQNPHGLLETNEVLG